MPSDHYPSQCSYSDLCRHMASHGPKELTVEAQQCMLWSLKQFVKIAYRTPFMIKDISWKILACLAWQTPESWTGLVLMEFYHYPEPVYTGWSSVHWNATGMPLVDPVYTGIPLGDPANTAGYTGTPLEKLSWNCPHWNATGETVTIAAYTGTPLEGL